MGKKSAQNKKEESSFPYPSDLDELKKILEVDILPGSTENQMIFLKWVQGEFQKRKELEWLLKEKEYQLNLLADTEKDSEEELDKIAKEAKFEGFIQPLNLARILAAEEDYRQILPELLDIFKCNLRRGKIKTDTPNRRKVGWDKLLRRLTGIGSLTEYADPILGRLPARMNYLNLYNQDPSSGDIRIRSIKDRDDTDFIKLEDLPQYFKKLQEISNMNFPLPRRLFPVTPDVMGVPSFEHSEDFRSLSYSGRRYTLTSRQAQVTQILFEAWEKKTPDVGMDFILEKLGTASSRLRDSFRSNPSVWKDLIKKGARKGTIRLNIPLPV